MCAAVVRTAVVRWDHTSIEVHASCMHEIVWVNYGPQIAWFTLVSHCKFCDQVQGAYYGKFAFFKE
jgi:hypothetical protein